MTDNMAVRTKFYDEFFLDSTEAGIRQAVILASGLDCRAYRLPWPDGTTVYEIDQPQVIEFKSRTLAEMGAQPTAYRRTVAIDLRDDWPAALRAAGFDPEQPAAWSAEGLLGYLPPEAQDRLLDTVTALSAPGSRIATESMPRRDDALRERLKEHLRTISERWRKHGLDLDMTELIYFGDRNEAAPYLSDCGWQITGSSTRELFAANGLPPLDDDFPFADRLYVSGTLTDDSLTDNSRSDQHDTRPIGKIRRRQLGPGIQRGSDRDDGCRIPRAGLAGTRPAARRSVCRSAGSRGGLDSVHPPYRRGGHPGRRPGAEPQERAAEQMAVRTRFFDDFFIAATEGGIRQAVILASGLDTQGLPAALAGRDGGLRDRPASGDRFQNHNPGRSRRRRRPPSAGRSASICATTGQQRCGQAGFDVNQPTAWSAEGLLPYLPPEAQDRLFDNITALSAPGSQLATEHISDPDAFSEESVQRIGERWRRAGFDLNPGDLFYQGERSIVIDYLTGHGWQVTAHPAPELYQRNGFNFPEDESMALFRDMSYVAATLG